MQHVYISIILFFLNQGHLLLAYTAAVLEYYPLISDTPKTTILFNLNEYRYLASKAKAKGADIIVFPEYGLTTLANNSRRYAIEVNPFSDVVNRLKYMASEFQMYIVVNLLEKFQFSACCDTPKFYNTNLVFDRNGSLILHYRKINLCKEDWLAPGSWNQTMTFSTDFGATFSVFTSHDILFGSPSRMILKKGVTDVAYPVAWTSTLPFYSTLGIQYGYFVSTGVNLLASSYNLPQQYLSGSGIYSGQNVKTFVTDSPTSGKLIIMNVTHQKKDICSNLNIDPYFFYSRIEVKSWSKDFDSSIYNFKTIENKNSSTEICYGDFCCTFDIVFREKYTFEYFKVVVFDGLVFFDQQKSHVRICSLLVCENDSNDSCGGKIQTHTKFSKIKVTRKVDDDSMFYMPLTLKFNLQPLGKISYCRPAFNNSKIELETTNAEGVLVFGIFGVRDSGSLCNVNILIVVLICFFWIINVILFL